MTTATELSQAIEAKLKTIGQHELDDALNKLSHLSDSEKEVLIELVSNITRHIFDAPNQTIRDTTDEKLIAIAKDLFDLE